jgi:cell division transport system ATP-binding protein
MTTRRGDEGRDDLGASAMIALDGVSKIFEVGPVKLTALADVSFTVAKGEFVVVCGPSGAGKTTLLRLLYRAESPSQGRVAVADRDLSALPRGEVPALRRAMGIVFQDAKLLSGRTVYENVAFVLRALGTRRAEVIPRTFTALKAVGLSARAQAYPAQLSQGEAHRVALARAIVKEPALLLADEPTGNLDEGIAAEIFDLLAEIWTRGTTVLLATHQTAVARRLDRRTLSLVGGRLVRNVGSRA